MSRADKDGVYRQQEGYCRKLEKVDSDAGAVRCGSIELEVHSYRCTSVSFWRAL